MRQLSAHYWEERFLGDRNKEVQHKKACFLARREQEALFQVSCQRADTGTPVYASGSAGITCSCLRWFCVCFIYLVLV